MNSSIPLDFQGLLILQIKFFALVVSIILPLTINIYLNWIYLTFINYMFDSFLVIIARIALNSLFIFVKD